jgi:hypothetical protein
LLPGLNAPAFFIEASSGGERVSDRRGYWEDLYGESNAFDNLEEVVLTYNRGAALARKILEDCRAKGYAPEQIEEEKRRQFEKLSRLAHGPGASEWAQGFLSIWRDV